MKNLWIRITKQLHEILYQQQSGENDTTDFSKSEKTMNIKWNHISGQWTKYKGQAQEQWGELTDTELMIINGRFEVLAAKLQEKYGGSIEEAKQQIDTWTAKLRI